MTGITKAKKPAASRASKHTKKYMRKGTDVAAYEQVLARANLPSGSVENTAVEDLFHIDRAPNAEVEKKKYTKRQQAKLDKLSKNVIDLDNEEADKLPAPKAPKRGSIKKLKSVVVARPEPVTNNKAKKNGVGAYDLWDTDFTPKVNLDHEKAAEHFLRFTKRKIPNVPGSLRQKSSVLGAVALPAAGASYNPTADDYTEYVGKIAAEEVDYQEREEKIEKGMRPKEETMVTVAERELEETEGLVIDPRYGKEENEGEKGTVAKEGDEASALAGPVEVNRKTKKQRETAARVKREERLRLKRKAGVLNENDVFKAKKMNKELDKEAEEQEKAIEERRVKKLTDQMTKRQRLGRGKFEEEEAPFLLAEELTENLRSLKPQGNILVDRIKSMQKRNMLPIGGAREKKNKGKLRRKFTEKRSARDITKGSHKIKTF